MSMKYSKSVVRGSLFLLSAATFAAAAPLLADHGAYPAPAIFERDAVVYGRTYADWTSAWYQWVSSQPASANPLFDTADCAAGQSGPVWFLGGRYCSTVDTECPNKPAERSCTVPLGKALFFPVVNFQCVDAEAKKGYCGDAGPIITEMRAFIGNGIDQTTNLKVKVDGRPVRANLKRDYRVQSPLFTSFLPEDNFLSAIYGEEFASGEVWGVDDGVYVMLKPLRKGKHTIRFTGTFPQYDFVLDFTYHLTVE